MYIFLILHHAVHIFKQFKICIICLWILCTYLDQTALHEQHSVEDSWDFGECLSVLIYTLAVGTAYLYLIWRLAAFSQTALCSKSPSSINYARDTVWIFNVASRLSLSLLTLGPYFIVLLFLLFCVLLLISIIFLVQRWIHSLSLSLFLFMYDIKQWHSSSMYSP